MTRLRCTITAMRESEGCKYLGVLEADGMLHDIRRKKIVKKYLRQVRKVAQFKLNGGNLIRAINTWALTMNGGFHPRDCVKRLYVRRNIAGDICPIQ